MPHVIVPSRNRRTAKAMRREMTEAELKLWNELRAHRLMGLSFRRQMPIAGCVVDFARPLHKLVVEVDGSQHGDADRLAADKERSTKLQALGWTVLRFWNDDVVKDIDNFCLHIVTAAGLTAEHAARQSRAGKLEHHP